MTLSTIITELKEEFPNLTKQINDKIVDLDVDEYEETINAWAEAKLAIQIANNEAKAKAAQKAALLDRLGITEDEAKLLLA
jgi:phosphoribosylformimino-5-aminoimidazole carboxamide ribonucleotide (ProFAR) isomerase